MAKKMKMSLIALLGCINVLLLFVTDAPVESATFQLACPKGKVAGESWKRESGGCERCLCHDYGSASCASCGIVAHSKDAKMIQDLSKPYPDCCPEYEEPEEDQQHQQQYQQPQHQQPQHQQQLQLPSYTLPKKTQ